MHMTGRFGPLLSGSIKVHVVLVEPEHTRCPPGSDQNIHALSRSKKDAYPQNVVHNHIDLTTSAEEMAKEIGVWDEFYGSGKTGKRKAKGACGKKADDGAEDDVSGLQALIQSRQKARMGALDALAEKYAAPQPKGKKRAAEGGPASKRKKTAAAEPDIDEEEFQRVQAGMKSRSKR